MLFLRESYGVNYFKYDTDNYPFKKIVTDIYGIKDLAGIGDYLRGDDKIRIDSGLVPNDKDGATQLHQVFYDAMHSTSCPLVSVYESFIKDVICEVFSTEDIIFQEKPTFRIQFPNNIAVGGNKNDDPKRYGWHRDTNPGYNHPSNEHNFIIPLTFSRDTASVYIESASNSDVFYPAEMNVGEFFMFKGGECTHGNKPNATGKSRVSLDFRVILPKDYDDRYEKRSARSEKRFVVGSYYKRLKDI